MSYKIGGAAGMPTTFTGLDESGQSIGVALTDGP
jgi:hypothetical protein